MPVIFDPILGKLRKKDTVSLSVKDFGAVGDGTTDDTAAIVSSITALGSSISLYGQAELTFPNGTYLTDGVIISSLSHFTLTGPGQLKLKRASVSDPEANTRDVLVLLSCTDFSINSLGINGNRHTDISWGVTNTDRAPVTQYLVATANSGQATVTVDEGSLFAVGERVWVMGGLTVNGSAEKDYRDDNNQVGLEILSIVGDVLTLESNLTYTYTGTGTVGGAYVTTYQTGNGNTVGAYTLGNEDQQNGIHLITCSRFTISNCQIQDTWESPIKLGFGFSGSDTSNVASKCTYGIIVNNRCERGYDQGISIWNSQYITVANNYCADAGWGACVLTGSDDCLVSNNILRDCYYRIPGDNSSGYGYVVEGGSRNILSGNQILDNYNANVLMRISPLTFGVSGTQLNGNHSWGDTTIDVDSASGFVVGATYMIRDGSKSESFTVQSIASNTLTITKKTRFYHPDNTPVGVRTAEDCTVENNLISGSIANHGMFVSPGIRINLRNNTVTRNYSKGLLIETAENFKSSGTVVDGNYFTGNGNGTGAQAILVDTCDDTQILNNRIFGNFGDKGIQLKGARYSKIVGNSVTDVQSEGIYLEEGGGIICDKIVISNNDVKQCDGSGIRVDRGNHFTITGNNCWSNAGDGGLVLGGLKWSTVKGNICIDNNTNGILLQDNNSVACVYNFIEGNVVRDDGSSIKGSDGSSMTQSVAIKLQNNEDNNRVVNNQVDVVTAKVGASTTIAGDLVN